MIEFDSNVVIPKMSNFCGGPGGVAHSTYRPRNFVIVVVTFVVIPDTLNSLLNCNFSINTLHNVCAVHRGVCSTTGDVQYNRGCSVHWVDIMSTMGGYHDRRGGRSSGKQLNLYGNPSVLNIPRCTHDVPPVY